jgi:hypothetical protein
MCKLKKGDKITVNVVDVTDHDEVWWDSNSFYVGENKLDRTIEKVEHVY